MPDAQDEIHRLAETLNAMLDRITASTERQRTFVGDAAHELRSPLASLRVQLEVAGRLGPAEDWDALIDDVLLDVDRLEHLVADLLMLARSDEAGGGAAPPRTGRVRRAGLRRRRRATRPPGCRSTSGRAGRSTVTVMGDPDSLRRVVVNLIDNAVRYAATVGARCALERPTAAAGRRPSR